MYGSDDVSVLISESSACKRERKGSETSQRKPETGGAGDRDFVFGSFAACSVVLVVADFVCRLSLVRSMLTLVCGFAVPAVSFSPVFSLHVLYCFLLQVSVAFHIYVIDFILSGGCFRSTCECVWYVLEVLRGL